MFNAKTSRTEFEKLLFVLSIFIVQLFRFSLLPLHPSLFLCPPAQARAKIKKSVTGRWLRSFLIEMKLLNFNFCASSLELLSDLVSLFLGDTLFESLGSCLNEVLSILKTKAGELTDNLDNVELGSACCLKDNVKLGLLLCCGSCCCAGSGCNCYGSCGVT